MGPKTRTMLGGDGGCARCVLGLKGRGERTTKLSTDPTEPTPNHRAARPSDEPGTATAGTWGSLLDRWRRPSASTRLPVVKLNTRDRGIWGLSLWGCCVLGVICRPIGHPRFSCGRCPSFLRLRLGAVFRPYTFALDPLFAFVPRFAGPNRVWTPQNRGPTPQDPGQTPDILA